MLGNVVKILALNMLVVPPLHLEGLGGGEYLHAGGVQRLHFLTVLAQREIRVHIGGGHGALAPE